MPLDVLFEIFSYLLPYDMLNLSRTSKPFRNLLMDRNSVSFWKAARCNVPGLPEPFPGMSEPVFANLCYSPHCHVCLKSNVQDVIWDLRIRLCNICKKTSTVSISVAKSRLYLKESKRLLPHISTYLVKWNDQVTDDWVRGVQRLLISDMDDVEKAWVSLPASKEGRDQFLKDEDRRFKDIEKHAEVCDNWSQNKKYDRSQELNEVRQEHLRTILRKLNEAGYGEDVTFSDKHRDVHGRDPICYHPFVRQAKPLTDRIWQNRCPA
ncbi:hypothetical protein QCA50_016374 [Cerrena zonata]|uniref:F-box domain-containing protein n=1 Tax=Cerrena zonata TaxID=2478898 RepID=A0AAW0FTG9_9APHY